MRLAHLRLLFVTAALGVAALAILVSGPGASGVRQSQAKLSPQAALDWNVIAVNTVRSATLTPAKFQMEGTLYMAYVQAAEYNAVMAISGRYAPYRSSLQAIPGASPRAAVAAAAYTTLSYYFPTLAPSLVSAYNDYLNVTLAQVPEKARLAGVAIGAAAASQLIVSRFGDGRDAPVSTAFGVAPQAPGTWVFAPPPSAQSAQTPWLANVKPFMLDSPDQFRAPAPPAITSPEYATDLNETEKMGSATSTARTAAQTATALFWNANVINQYNQVYRTIATSHNFDLVDTVRLLAMGNMVASDAGIACMDSKYHYLYWRPITAIRGAGLDGNAAITADPAWSPSDHHPEPPRIPERPRLRHRGRHRGAHLRPEDAQHQHRRPGSNRRRHDPDHLPALRDRRRPPQERRRRSCLGRPPLPLLDDRGCQPRHPGRPVRPEGQLPADEEVTDRDQAAAIAAAALSNTNPPSQASTSAGTWVGA